MREHEEVVQPLRDWVRDVAPNIIGKASIAELNSVIEEVERRAYRYEFDIDRRVQREVLGRFEDVKDALRDAYRMACTSEREFTEEWDNDEA